MKITNFALLSAAMIFAVSGYAQDTPKFEVYGDYSYLQFNPTLSGLQSRAFNGGGGGVQWNAWKFLGVKGDFQGYGSTQWTLTETAPVVTPHGTIPAGTYKTNFNQFTYMFGPVVGVHASKFTVFGELLFGQSNTNAYGSLVQAINAGGGTINASTTQHPFTMAFGGGVDYNINHRFALRLADMDWVLTRFTNPLTDTNNQNSFRYLGGFVVRFGGSQ
jgi:hypothetical protein